ncbi:hypothetical protein L6R52_19600 [Myxococcota bacterium]|nr:hypothetical protein [Myxococcota bacterium]
MVRLPSHTVHVDLRSRAIHLRATTSRDELGGSILESFPLTALARVRVIRERENVHHIELELRSKRRISLGSASAHEWAMTTARAVADATRTRLEISEETVPLPSASEAFSAAETFDGRAEDLQRGAVPSDPFEAPTRRIEQHPRHDTDPSPAPDVLGSETIVDGDELARTIDESMGPKLRR